MRKYHQGESKLNHQILHNFNISKVREKTNHKPKYSKMSLEWNNCEERKSCKQI